MKINATSSRAERLTSPEDDGIGRYFSGDRLRANPRHCPVADTKKANLGRIT